MGLQRDLSDISLEGRDLRSFFLTGKRLIRANLERARFDDADLRGADLRYVDALGARFDGARMAHADLRAGQFGTVPFPGEDPVTPASFRRAFLSGADLRAARAPTVDFSQAFLGGAVARRTDLERARLRDAALIAADLRDAILLGADLRGAKLGHATLCGAGLVGARLEGAEYNRSTRWPRGFRPRDHGARRTSTAGQVEVDEQGGMLSLVIRYPPCG